MPHGSTANVEGAHRCRSGGVAVASFLLWSLRVRRQEMMNVLSKRSAMGGNCVLPLVGLLLVGVLVLAPACQPDPWSPHPSSPPRANLVYYSDYFSFIGWDERGRVAFALDNNRGWDGDSWQAEHFVVLHDEAAGWVDVVGTGVYENARRELETIPDSSHFRFEGDPGHGISIVSQRNALTIQLEPIPRRLVRQHGGALYWMGSAAGTLTWHGRRLTGRAIYEFLSVPGFNRLTRNYPGLWKRFHGIYALLGKEGDLYWHSQRSSTLSPLTGELAGFIHLGSGTKLLDDLQVEVVRTKIALGLFRWPNQFTAQWGGNRSSCSIVLTEPKTISNWIIGGFAMGIVKGSATVDGAVLPVYGLGELLM